MRPDLPEPPQRCTQTHPELDLALADCPTHPGAEVVRLLFQSIEPDSAIDPGQCRRGPRGELEEPASMATGGRLGFTSLEEVLASVLPKGLEHVVARLGSRLGLATDQAFVEQRRHEVEGIGVKFVGSERDGVRGFQTPAAPEDRQAPERGPLFRRQQSITPGHGSMQRSMSLWDVACRVRQQAEAVLQSIQDGRGRQCLGSGGRELNGQRKAVQAAADPRDVGQRPLVGVEIGRDGARPLHEELDRLRGRRGRIVRISGHPKRWNDELVLTGQVQGGPARDEHAQTRGGSHPTRHRGSAVHEVLEVVEHKEQLPFGEIAADDVPHRPAGLFADGQDLGDRVCDEVLVLDRRKRNKPRTVREGAQRAMRHVNGEPRLPTAGWPGQRDQTLRCQERQEPLDLRRATDEPRRRIRKRMRDRG